jgi:hypothetical protein
MAQSVQQQIPRDKFLMIAMNLLHRQFIAAARTPAKRLFREILDGRTVPLTTVKMEDNSTVRFRLSLEQSEYVGNLNYSAFRASLATLLGNISQALQNKSDVTVFTMDQRTDSIMFGITGVTIEDAKPSVMVLGADVEGQAGAITLQLMYIDPGQFAQQGAVAAAPPGGLA